MMRTVPAQRRIAHRGEVADHPAAADVDIAQERHRFGRDQCRPARLADDDAARRDLDHDTRLTGQGGH
jgi:hypothetical protein